MLNENGKYDVLSLSDAQTLVLAEATLPAGVEVLSGSPEEQIENWMAQGFVEVDASQYASIVKQFNPTGADIDLQNPGTPRLTAQKSAGYLQVHNTSAAIINVTANSVFTAPNGNAYTNGTNLLTVAIGATGYVSAESALTGSAQNLPSGQTFASSYSAVVTNPQPFSTGTDSETDTQYLSRLIFLRTNNTSTQATPAALKELLASYSAAKIYINNSSADYTVPVPVPTGGYVAIVLFPSGVNAGANEISSAINILLSRFEFGNILRALTALHPLLSGTVYTGTFPQLITVAPAQVVKATLTATLIVSFPAGTDASEKNIIATAFATTFVKNMLDFYGGAAGNFNMVFQESGSPAPSPVNSTPSVVSGSGAITIAPLVAIEQIRAFISDEITAKLTTMNYLACSALRVILDPVVAGESTHVLDIAAPSGGTVAKVDFINDALFSDSTSWYDRYLFLDPSLITIMVEEA